MVRAFLLEFSEFVRAHGDGWQSPRDPEDPTADRQLEAFLERLAVDAGQIDEGAERPETEALVQHDIEHQLCELLQHAAWNRRHLSRN
jgi:hypothetical protein